MSKQALTRTNLSEPRQLAWKLEDSTVSKAFFVNGEIKKHDSIDRLLQEKLASLSEKLME